MQLQSRSVSYLKQMDLSLDLKCGKESMLRRSGGSRAAECSGGRTEEQDLREPGV